MRYLARILRVAYRRYILPHLIRYTSLFYIMRINLGCGSQKIPGYMGVDLVAVADLMIDLSRCDLPFRDNTLEVVVCTSAINYVSYTRAQELIRETYRVLKQGGVARFSVQDLELLARRYVEKDGVFFCQTLPDGRQRFEGATLGDKFVSWFYGYRTAGGVCKYVYDYDSLAHLFHQAGFSIIERRKYGESRLENIELIDNRPEQMFFLEAVK